jgi:hypothetical protein
LGPIFGISYAHAYAHEKGKNSKTVLRVEKIGIEG